MSETPETPDEVRARAADLAVATGKATAVTLAEVNRIANRVRVQLFACYVVLVLVLAGVTYSVHQDHDNCLLLNRGHRAFNALLDQSIANSAQAGTLTPQQKAERIAKYQAFHLVIQKCPPF